MPNPDGGRRFCFIAVLPSQKPDPGRRRLLRCSPPSPAHSLLCWCAGSCSPSRRARLAVQDAEQEQASSCQQGGSGQGAAVQGTPGARAAGTATRQQQPP
ncbi:hypothetical protein E2562_017052 [Oryza meyeriana var. granulata]|uniref:Uncharacterized protein n=1 Tax=Oryza meyeriana var. granulata TaxID=110450 RepID=A0A6G1F8S0_9ORYZ|nr:hypothetical protein E2562_017052 [Oryza meyeriana var. granulata]